jgi:chromate reductase
MPTVGYLVGSLAADSINRQLAATLVELAPPSLRMVEIPLAGLPLYDRDVEDPVPAAVQSLKDAISGCDAVLLVTPEHNRSVPAVLKNALDWASRPWGDNTWHAQRVAMIGTGLNGAGTAVAQAHLRGVLGYLGTLVMGAPEVCVPWTDGVLERADTRNYLSAFLDALAEHAAGLSRAA